MATVGAVYSVDRFVRTPEQVLEALFHDPDEPPSPDAWQRPRLQHQSNYAQLDDDPQQPEAVKGQAANSFGWLDEQIRVRLKRLWVAAGGWSDLAVWLAGFAIGRSRQSVGAVIMLGGEQLPL